MCTSLRGGANQSGSWNFPGESGVFLLASLCSILLLPLVQATDLSKGALTVAPHGLPSPSLHLLFCPQNAFCPAFPHDFVLLSYLDLRSGVTCLTTHSKAVSLYSLMLQA